eukprot:g60881.t1
MSIYSLKGVNITAKIDTIQLNHQNLKTNVESSIKKDPAQIARVIGAQSRASIVAFDKISSNGARNWAMSKGPSKRPSTHHGTLSLSKTLGWDLGLCPTTSILSIRLGHGIGPAIMLLPEFGSLLMSKQWSFENRRRPGEL